MKGELDYERKKRLCVIAAEKISQKVLPICVVQTAFILLILNGLAFKSMRNNLILIAVILILTSIQIVKATKEIKKEIDEERNKY